MIHDTLNPLALAAAILVPSGVLAQTAPASLSSLPPVTVTGTRIDAPPFDVPASIDRIGSDTIADTHLQVNLSESLGGVPGLLARERQNYAQDLQISVRGFGARSAFGIRGVRLYVDGIPATLPDGQGQISHVDLGSAERIEVLRGPFSALYGNSSGGVIQVFTEDGTGAPTVTLGAAGGSDGAARVGTKVSGANGTLGYVLDVSRFRTDGYREHSATQRDIGNVKLTFRPDPSSKLSIVANSLDLPEAQDPLGLTRSQFDADPRSVDPVALSFNTRKSVNQTQLGATYERELDAADSLRVLAYGGHRGTEQFQAIPTGPQANPLHPGGVIVLGRDYSGADLRWTLKQPLGEQPVTLVAGLAYDTLAEHRRGVQNVVGSTLGVEGALRRDEHNDVTNVDEYLQASWQIAPAWTLDAGLRHSSVRFRSTDAYIVGSNGDDSGSTRFGATLPVAALMFRASERVHLYAAAGRGFETPTLNELAYRPQGVPGLNFGLQAAHSDNVEVGVKTRFDAVGELNAALFETRTDHEIVTQTNSGGRSTYQNAGRTQRKGLELAWSRRYGENLRAQAAYTWLDARYADGFATCTGTPCAAPNQQIPAGNRIPGIARSALYAALGWAPPVGWRAGVEARLLSRVAVNDANSEAAAGYGVASANLGYVAHWAGWEWRGFGRLDNLAGRKVSGSVIVNESSGRYYEPAPGRTWLVGVSGAFTF